MLEVEGNVSRMMKVGRGVLPGCSQSMPWVKIYIYEALEACHYSLNGEASRVLTRAYVDDISQNMHGDEAELCDDDHHHGEDHEQGHDQISGEHKHNSEGDVPGLQPGTQGGREAATNALLDSSHLKPGDLALLRHKK